MTRRSVSSEFFDSMYGAISFNYEISLLIDAPILQRLRHVRLSNIDSLDMPGIANLSRFEHSLGVGYLASQMAINQRLSQDIVRNIVSAALLHDWAMTAYGHLVEEALQYAGTGFDHEKKLKEIISSEGGDEVGGADRQILLGRETGIGKWLRKVSGEKFEEDLACITELITGNGNFGKTISGNIDLDNIDNVYRMAFHMGLDIDRSIPLKIATSIVDVLPENRELVFKKSSQDYIDDWLGTRSAVYDRLMLSPRDFSGKVMLLSASIAAFETKEITESRWNYTDFQYLSLLVNSSASHARETASRWLAGELWQITPLFWMDGRRPSFPKLRQFSEILSDELGKQCFAYGIKDKRERDLVLHMDDGTIYKLGRDPNQWVLGVGTPTRKSFQKREVEKIFRLGEEYFSSSRRAQAQAPQSSDRDEVQPCLI